MAENNTNNNLGKLDSIFNAISEQDQQKTAFDELLVAETVPRVQLQFPYNINLDLVTISTSGTGIVTQANTKAILQTSANSNSYAKLESKRTLKYNPGQGALARFTAVFTPGISGSSQLIGIGDDLDGFFVGCIDETFGVLRRHDGAEFWVPQTNWNGDLANGNNVLPLIDFTKGNVFQIRYQWLGYGAIKYYIENPINGKLILIHTIRYANTYIDTSIHNPTLPLYAKVENTTNTTNIQLNTSSMGAFIEGRDEHTASSLIKSKSNTKSGITTENNILTVRNKSIYHSIINRVRIKPKFLSVTNEGNKDVEFRVLLNAEVFGPVNYNNINLNTSTTEYDIDGTTVSTSAGGTELFIFELSKNSSDNFTIPFDVNINPGENLVITASSDQSTEVKVALTWLELF